MLRIPLLSATLSSAVLLAHAALAAPTIPSAASALASAPTGFVANQGQIAGPARFYATDPQGAVYFEPHSVLLDRRVPGRPHARLAVRVDFPARSVALHATGEEPLGSPVNVFTGTRSANW